jgi:uncharacterized protein YkwD
MKKVFFIFLIAVIATPSFSQSLNTEETKLYNLIMDYRRSEGLPNIPLSKSLTIVAQTHVRDLEENRPDKGACNMHSWSANGKWTPCCYTADHAKAQGMWNKPKELTNYKGDGYEIAFNTTASATAETALGSWKTSKGHNDVILNKSIWKTQNWKAIGIGVYQNYAVVWFGSVPDL